MSDSPIETPASSSSVDDFDSVLMLLVRIANSSPGWSIDVTLWLPGGPVTGRLISGETWTSSLETALDDAGSHGLTPLFEGLHERYAALAAAEDCDDDDPIYIHLIDARVMSGPLLIPGTQNSGFTWRGRLSEVAYWAVGSVGASGPAE